MKRVFFGLFAACVIFSAAAKAETVADALKSAQDKEGQGDWAGAIDIYNAVLQQFPKEFPEAYALRASDRVLVDDNKGAVADYTKALALDKDPKDPILNHGHIYAELADAKRFSGDTKGAVADYRQSLKLDPDSFVYSNLAETEMDAGDCAASNSDYSQSIALATVPEVIDYEGRGNVRLCLGDIANSYSDYQSAVALELKETPTPQFQSLYLDAWALGVKLGRKDDADKAMTDQMAGAAPWNDTTLPDLDRDIASVYLGKADISLIAKDAAAYAHGNPADSWNEYGFYYTGLKQMADGDNKAAIASFQQAVDAKSHLNNTQLQARAWIRILGGAKKK
jgi:tetratricopeptide (TPR) repeat protein